MDFHPEEEHAAAAAAAGRGAAAAGGLHLSLDCRLTTTSLLLHCGGGAAAEAQAQAAGGRRTTATSTAAPNGIAALELDQLDLQVQVQPRQVSASLKLADAALHDLCSTPGISSQVLSRGAEAAEPASPASPVSGAQAPARSPLVRLHFTATPAEPGQPEQRPQMDVLVQPLLLRLHPVCLQCLMALVPPVVPVRLGPGVLRWGRAGTAWLWQADALCSLSCAR